MRHVVVMLTTSYPRFEGDTVGTFMAPIAHGVAARGHEVHVVAPWHPLVQRPAREGAVSFHFYRYAPHPSLNVFGYAGALREDVALRGSAWLAAPLALAAGWRAARSIARRARATVMHGHWVIPGGATALAAAPSLPLVVSLHGSDVYVAERHASVGRVARSVFRRAGWVTACSEDLRTRALALGASASRSSVVPYGVDTARFARTPALRATGRNRLGVGQDEVVILGIGRLVRKKGFEYLVEAVARLSAAGRLVTLVLAGGGDLDAELRERARAAGIAAHVRFPGNVPHDQVAAALAAADIVVVPSIRDDAGNVDGLPNVVLEALASGTPLVATSAGGIGAVVRDQCTGLLVAERDPLALAAAIASLLDDPARAAAIGEAARHEAAVAFGWDRAAERFELAYNEAAENRG